MPEPIVIVDELGDLVVKSRTTYKEVKAHVLKRGAFSVFEATQNERAAKWFDKLESDPEVECYRNPPGFPWIGVRLKEQT